MKLFLDTADVKQIKRWKEIGVIDGVTTNPTHLSKAGGSPRKTVLEICKLLPKGEISVEVTEKKPDAVYTQAKQIAKLSKNILVKIPCHRDYYPVIAKLAKERVKMNITLVFTVLQGLMMCKLGVDYISPFVGRWEDLDVDGSDVLEQLRIMIDEYGYNTKLLAASIRTVPNFNQAIMAGADAVTLPVSILEKSTEHVLTNRGIEKFDADWKKLSIRKFP